MTTMDAATVRHHALDIAWAAINLSIVDPDLWQSVPMPRITAEEEDALRVELRVIADAVKHQLDRLLPPPVQPVWVPAFELKD